MTEVTVLLMMTAGMLTMLDWRKGLAMCVLVGIAQDPLRKLAPGQPVYYVLLVGVIFAVAWVRAALLNVPLTLSVIYGWRQNLKAPVTLFGILVFAQAMHSFVRYDTLVMPAVGLLVWLAPIPAIVLGYQYASRRGLGGVRRLMLLYVAIAMVALSGVYFEYADFGWSTLGEVGEGLIIYDVGTALKAHSGFFRASEIAAWHTATMACFIFILSIGKRPTALRIFSALVLVAVLAGLGTLTGRRKMLIEIAIFICTYGFLVAWLQRGFARLAMVILAVALTAYIGIVGFVSPDLVKNSYSKSVQLANPNRFEGYALRGQSVLVDLPLRISAVGVQPVIGTVEQFGWLGAGLGTGSQGTNQIAEQHNIDRGAAEGGLGKVAMELGVPGLLLVAWLFAALGRHLRQQLAAVTRISPQHTRMAYGLVAFLVANAATFSVATQAYSDPFILLILGWTMGFLFAVPALAEKYARQQAAAGQPESGLFSPTRPGGVQPLPAHAAVQDR